VSWWYLVIVAACHSVNIIIIIIITDIINARVNEKRQRNVVDKSWRKDSCTADILSYDVIATANGKLNWKKPQHSLYSQRSASHWRNVLLGIRLTPSQQKLL